MKKTERMFSVVLMAIMFITSAGLLYASLYASGGGTQSTFGAVVFEKETGIRYNNLTKEFEVFNEAGVSWIASGRYISVDGVVMPLGTSPNPSSNNYEIADGNKIYNIMCDISYTGTYIGEPADSSIYNTAFDTDKITLQSSGILDGRGFYLKNFVVKPVSIDSKTIGTALVKTNAGTIRNLNMSNADITSQAPESVASAAAIIVGKNTGTIDSCTVYGTASNNTYESNKYTGLYAIAAINSNRITNCTNNANLTNTATTTAYAAGIASVGDGATLYNNTNNGNISTINAGHAAGIAIDAEGVEFTARGNVNNGNINAANTASSIIDGGVNLLDLTAKGNANNGTLQGTTNSYPFYYGVAEDNSILDPVPLDRGIRWLSSLNGGSGGFEIYTTDGISWIASGQGFDENGLKGGSHIAAQDSYYEIRSGITTLAYADRTIAFNSKFGGTNEVAAIQAPSLAEGGQLNGNNCKLELFPIRRCSPTSNYYSALFESSLGRIEKLKMSFNDTLDLHKNDAFVGGMAGYAQGGSFKDIYISGLIDCGTKGRVGGIIGYSDSESTNYDSPWSWGNGVVAEITIYGDIVGAGFGFEDFRNCWAISGFYINFNGFLKGVTAAGGAGGVSGRNQGIGTYVIRGEIQADSAGLIYGIYYYNANGGFVDTTGSGTILDCKINGDSTNTIKAGTYLP